MEIIEVRSLVKTLWPVLATLTPQELAASALWLFIAGCFFVVAVACFVWNRINMTAWRREVQGAHSNEQAAFRANVRTLLDSLSLSAGDGYDDECVVIEDRKIPGNHKKEAELLREIRKTLD